MKNGLKFKLWKKKSSHCIIKITQNSVLPCMFVKILICYSTRELQKHIKHNSRCHKKGLKIEKFQQLVFIRENSIVTFSVTNLRHNVKNYHVCFIHMMRRCLMSNKQITCVRYFHTNSFSNIKAFSDLIEKCFLWG